MIVPNHIPIKSVCQFFFGRFQKSVQKSLVWWGKIQENFFEKPGIEPFKREALLEG